MTDGVKYLLHSVNVIVKLLDRVEYFTFIFLGVGCIFFIRLEGGRLLLELFEMNVKLRHGSAQVIVTEDRSIILGAGSSSVVPEHALTLLLVQRFQIAN